MTVTLSVAIAALLISCLVGIGLGYSLPQRQLKQMRQKLAKQQQRFEAMEAAYEERLQRKTEQLYTDYQAELTRHIAHYHDQLVERTQEIHQEHQAYLEVMQQPSLTGPGTDPAGSPEAQALKKQYEARLKEAAQKLQQAYEQQLAHRITTTRSDLQQAYESRLAQKIEHYENQLTTRLEQLETEFSARQETLQGSGSAADEAVTGAIAPNPQSPSAIMGTGNDDPTVTLAPGSYPLPKPPAAAVSGGSDAAEPVQVLVEAKVQEARQIYETQLAEKLAQYQDRWVARMAELEADYSDRLAALQQVSPPVAQPSIVDQLDPLDLGDISQLS
ncbi:MAG: hypothetical protein VKJ09_14050 [Leptolyngbya sp.]|nr:hypothetical protein [Leptolyngbya sp.]